MFETLFLLNFSIVGNISDKVNITVHPDFLNVCNSEVVDMSGMFTIWDWETFIRIRLGVCDEYRFIMIFISCLDTPTMHFFFRLFIQLSDVIHIIFSCMASLLNSTTLSNRHQQSPLSSQTL